MRSGSICGALLVVAAASLTSHALAQGDVVQLDPTVQQRLGIQTAPLVAARRADEAAGFARGIDAGPLAALDADIVAATSALEASRGETARTRTLLAADSTVSKKAAEVAAAQARADAAKLHLLRRRLGLEWSPALGSMSDARRSRLLNEIAAGRAALVRIDAPGDAVAAAGSVRLDLGAHGQAHAALLGPARIGDTRLQTPGWLAVVVGNQAAWLAPGVVVPAALEAGAGAAGVVVPREALVRSHGETFAYVRRDSHSFERRPVAGAVSDPRGLFAAGGFRPGEQIVTRGAAKIYAASAPGKAED
jgi:hypothetical protein